LSTEAKIILDAKLAAIEQAVRDAQAFEHEHGIASSRTRKLPGDVFRTLRGCRCEESNARAQGSLARTTVRNKGKTRSVLGASGEQR